MVDKHRGLGPASSPLLLSRLNDFPLDEDLLLGDPFPDFRPFCREAVSDWDWTGSLHRVWIFLDWLVAKGYIPSADFSASSPGGITSSPGTKVLSLGIPEFSSPGGTMSSP